MLGHVFACAECSEVLKGLLELKRDAEDEGLIAGRPAGPERTAVAPFTVPQSPAASWLRVSARRNGDAVAHSAWIPVGR